MLLYYVNIDPNIGNCLLILQSQSVHDFPKKALMILKDIRFAFCFSHSITVNISSFLFISSANKS